jgi:hypothetical protein
MAKKKVKSLYQLLPLKIEKAVEGAKKACKSKGLAGREACELGANLVGEAFKDVKGNIDVRDVQAVLNSLSSQAEECSTTGKCNFNGKALAKGVEEVEKRLRKISPKLRELGDVGG